MASTTTFTATVTSTTTATATATTGLNYHRCHACNTDVSPANTTSLRCPNCNSDSIEQAVSNPNPNSNYPNENPSRLTIPSFSDSSIPTTTSNPARTFPFPSVTASDDNFLLDSPYLHRLINHLTNSNDSPSSPTPSLHQSPTSKSAIESIPMVKITSSLLDIDPIVLCAVCKDQFVIDDETKQLPCKHMYHPDCILPWLSQHNSCPVCRFLLPKEPILGDVKVRRRSRSRILRLGDLMEDVDDEAMLGIGFRNLHHHRYLQSEVDPEVRFPMIHSHIGQTVEVDVLPDSGQENGIETASRLPGWHVNVRAVDGGENGVHARWVDDSDDAIS